MKTIYVVTEGYYSDYHIVAVFDNLEDAKKCATEYVDDEGRVEEYSLNGKDENGRSEYWVFFELNGNARAVLTGKKVEHCSNRFQKQLNGDVLFEICAKDEKQAIKIASERYLQVKAMPYAYPNWNKPLTDGRGDYYPTYNFLTHEMTILSIRY